MRLHRFYIGDEIKLEHSFWLHHKPLIHQWRKVLRLTEGSEVILFDGTSHDRLYKILKLTKDEAHLQHITDINRQVPEKDIYLFWSLLKKDKNDWVLQKCTELGVKHFIPLLAGRSEKTGFNLERAQKIIIEASEQCGRSDIPTIREPMLVETAISDYKNRITLVVCEQADNNQANNIQTKEVGVLIGPEGGWEEKEKEAFAINNLTFIGIGQFTLRAETAAVSVAAQLLR